MDNSSNRLIAIKKNIKMRKKAFQKKLKNFDSVMLKLKLID